MSARTVWLASFPKSGNTWVRAILTALTTHEHLFAVNHLGSGSQPFAVSGALNVLGLDPRWVAFDEARAVRAALIRDADADVEHATDIAAPLVRKTHERYRTGPPGREPFPADATRAAILIVRDPRDIVGSYSAFFGDSLDDTIGVLAGHQSRSRCRPSHWRTEQPWGSWSAHARSWLGDDVPFPVHLIRYEDLLVDPATALVPVLAAIGMSVAPEALDAAIEQARFDRLKEAEARTGFTETSPMSREFFRYGRAGGWRHELTDDQVAAVEADHADTMLRLGYDVTHDEHALDALARERTEARTARASRWLVLPDHLGLTVREGVVPEDVPGAVRPRTWLQATDRIAAVRFAGGAAVMVEDGRDVTVQWQPDPDQPDADPSWLVQGWAVTLAALQRGNLSLHAASMEIGDEVVAIAGRRGAGKSTTAMGLRARGHRLLVDDVTLIEFDDSGSAWTTPYSRNVHLLPDSAAALGVDFASLPMLAVGRDKAAFRPEDPGAALRRIDRVVVLMPTPRATAVTLRSVRGADRIPALINHVSRDGIAPVVLGPQRYFTALAKLAAAAQIQVVERPQQGWSLDEVLDAIEAGDA